MPLCYIKRSVYSMEQDEDGNAELTLYGNICQTRPVGWDDEPIEGDFICQDEFLEDFENIQDAKTVTIRINSLGGDASVGLLIHNKLRELSRGGTVVNGIVDGVAMSAGSIILSACDHVSVNPSSLIMIHRASSMLWGFYNQDELAAEAEALDAWDKAMIACYQSKTGLSEAVLNHMISDTTYMTGREAVEKGFADELLDEAPVEIAASADGRCLFIHGKQFHLAPGMFAPDSVPTVEKSVEIVENGGNEPMPMEEKLAERKRLQEIDAIASLYDPALVEAAKYGENPMDAMQLAYQGALQAVQRGQKFLKELDADVAESGAQEVPSAGCSEEAVPVEQMTPEQRRADAKAKLNMIFGGDSE